MDAAINEALDVDASTVPDISLDTTGLSVTEVVQHLREQIGAWPRIDRSASVTPVVLPDTTGDILWLSGPTGVGKSTVGWELFMRAWRDGRRAALIDLQQIGFLQPAGPGDPDNHGLKARNLAAMWATIRADGADGLIVVGAVDDRDQLREYTNALPASTLTLVLLQASRDQLAERIIRRWHGEGPRIPGDQLLRGDSAKLGRIADHAAISAARIARAGFADVVVDTDGLTVDEVIQAIQRQIGN